jgi:hypothetical protein
LELLSLDGSFNFRDKAKSRTITSKILKIQWKQDEHPPAAALGV